MTKYIVITAVVALALSACSLKEEVKPVVAEVKKMDLPVSNKVDGAEETLTPNMEGVAPRVDKIIEVPR